MIVHYILQTDRKTCGEEELYNEFSESEIREFYRAYNSLEIKKI